MGEGTFWLYEEQGRPYGLVITVPRFDELSETGALLIYAAYSFGGLSAEMIEQALETLSQHAEEIGLEEVIAFSKNEQLVRFLTMNGASANYRLISYEV